ncbi:exonuclease rnase t and dna polymerase iii [Moniliophthora roreri]|nr:exonuclease rnase t and dna polymerase iii [Moniliophthora roreri]
MSDHSNYKRRRLEGEIEEGEPDPVEKMMQYYLPTSQVQRQAIRRRIYELERNETIQSYITDNLVLTRPLVAFDLETTGLYPQGGPAPYIISIFFPAPLTEIHVFKSGNLRDWDGSVYVRCTEPSDPDALKIHCIEPSHLKHLPSFHDYARDLHQFLRGCDITGFNINMFDTPVLTEEFKRAGITWQPLRAVDTKFLYNTICEKRGSLQDAHKEFVGEYFAGAHNAEADTIATLRLLYGMVAKEQRLRMAVERILRPTPPPRRAVGPTRSSPALLGGRT